MPSTGTLSWRNMRDRAGGVEQGDLLGRADDDRAGQRQRLGQGQRYVAGARGQVDHQVVERSPVDLAEELLHDPVEHRPAHDDGAFGLEQEAHRHQLEAVGLDRLDALAPGHGPAAWRRPGGGSTDRRRRRPSGRRWLRRSAGRRRWPRPSSTCRPPPCPSRPRSRS